MPAMDVARKTSKLKKTVWRTLLTIVGLCIIAAITLGLARLKSANPSIDRRTIITGIAKRGSMLREVRGAGTLVPKEVVWVTASTAGRIKSIFVEPGTAIKADTVLLELQNPDLELAVLKAKGEMESAQAALRAEQANHRTSTLARQTNIAKIESDLQIATTKTGWDERLAKKGYISLQDVKNGESALDCLKRQLEVEKTCLEETRRTESDTLAVKQADVEQMRRLYEFSLKQVDFLKVRAGVNGVLENLSVDVVGIGKQIGAGTVLAKVSDPKMLKAVLRISETQARDVQLGLPATIEMLNAEAKGKVIRIDPAVVSGNVAVDVALDGTLPRGARPDLSVTGSIELEYLQDVIYVERPVFASGTEVTKIFKFVENGAAAIRVPVQFGRSSAMTIEVVKGLAPKDEIILSDMSRWDEAERVEMK